MPLLITYINITVLCQTKLFNKTRSWMSAQTWSIFVTPRQYIDK